MRSRFRKQLLILPILLTACAVSTNTTVVEDKNAQSSISVSNCLTVFPVREVKKPYKNSHIFSQEEFAEHLRQMKISSVCIPQQFGAPFLNTDWNSETQSADQGRKVSIGFEKMFDENFGGWGNLFLEYSTHDFAVGSEYFTYANRQDYEKLQGQSEADILVNGVKGIVKYEKVSFFDPEDFWLEKQVVFPFKDYYIALVYKLNGDYGENFEDVLVDLRNGKVPARDAENLRRFDEMVNSLVFLEKQ